MHHNRGIERYFSHGRSKMKHESGANNQQEATLAERADMQRLAMQLCARLCHDLSGPIGTLQQTLELIQGGPDDTEALSLAREAARTLIARLRLLRTAWGPDTVPLDLPALRGFAEGLPAEPPVRLDFAGLGEATVFPPATGRVILNLLLLARESLPKGGRIALSGEADDVFIIIEGPRAAWPAGLPLCAASADTARAACLDARTLQMPLTTLLAHAAGLRLSVLMSAAPGGAPPLRLSTP